MITLTANNEALYFYSELLSGSFVEGNAYSFTFDAKFEREDSWTIELTCDVSNGYVTVFSGDLSPIEAYNSDITIDGNPTLDTLRALWNKPSTTWNV